jgi:hypothetical protein
MKARKPSISHSIITYSNTITMRILLLTLCLVTTCVDAFQSPQPLGRRQLAPSKLTVRKAMELDSSLFVQADEFWQTFPYTAAAIVCGIKASAADFVAQSSSSSSSTEAWKDPDWKRNLSFLIYGSLYQGIAHEYSFNHLYPLWFGTGTDIACVATKVSFNLLVQTTFVTLPVAYVIQATLKEEGLDVAFDKYINDIMNQGLLVKCFALWGPVHCLTFSVVPEHWRVTFVAVVSFFWLIIFSSISANQEAAEEV